MYYANKKWAWVGDFAATYRKMKAKPYFRFVAFFPGDVLDFDRNASVPEMHDRIIAGLARRLNAPLITSDALIANAQLITIAW